MLKAGFAKLDVTPPFGTGIAGYFRERKVKGILDPIYLCCLAVEKDGERLLIITGDFMGIKMGVCKRMAESIEARTGVPATSVIVQALHPHTSTALNTQPVLNHVHEGTYFDFVMMKAGDVAELALADLEEATLTGATGEVAEKISFVRRYFMKDGTVKTNPGFDKAADIIGPCDEPDNSVRLLRFKREKGDIALVNFACHPDVIGGELLSADWPGFVRRFVEAEHPGTACIFCNGFQGDSNHLHYMSGVRKGGYEHSRFMGRVVADAVNALWEQVTPIKADSVGVKSKTVYTKTRTEELERYDELKAFHDAYWAGKLDYTPSGEELARARRVTDLLTAPIFRPIPVTVAHIGDVILAALGGEPFTYYIRAVRALCPDKTVLTLCAANGFEGYFPTAKAFVEGGYEAASSPFTPALESELVEAFTKLVEAQ